MTCTPVMAKRSIKADLPPETPWLKSGRIDRKADATPVMNGAITIQKANFDKSNFVHIGGVPIKKPN